MDQELHDFADKAINYAVKSGAKYCDARAEQQERKSVLLEDKETEHININEDKGIGIRILKDNTWSFCSVTNPNSYGQVKDAIDNSFKISNENSKNKIELYPNTSKKLEEISQ